MLTREGKLLGGATLNTQVSVIETASGLERVELPPGLALAFAPTAARRPRPTRKTG